MPEFEDIRSQLSAAGEDRQQAARALFRERQRLAKLKRDRKDAGRAGRDDLGALDQAIRRQDEQIAGLKGRLEALTEGERSRFVEFADFSDPRKAVSQLSDQTPVLMLPLRIETRFKLGAEQGRDGDELWVRVYPDDIAVDVFEGMLSESEAQKARTLARRGPRGGFARCVAWLAKRARLWSFALGDPDLPPTERSRSTGADRRRAHGDPDHYHPSAAGAARKKHGHYVLDRALEGGRGWRGANRRRRGVDTCVRGGSRGRDCRQLRAAKSGRSAAPGC
jgi:hypothetical protein